MMKVFVLGHTGMLGHVAAAYLRQRGFEVLTTNARYTGLPADSLVAAVRESHAEWVINAIGKIKQKTANTAELINVNAQLPVQLKIYLRRHQRLIHASTDCVFSGAAGNYAADDERDAEDVYGFSKALGEVVAETGKCQIIRASIIGPEIKGSAGLMGWFLSQKKGVKGFTNHHWNGITTLEWVKVASEIMRGELLPGRSILQVSSEASVSKFELLQAISDTWQHHINIEPVAAPQKIDRTLDADLVRNSIHSQLQELYAWYRNVEPTN